MLMLFIGVVFLEPCLSASGKRRTDSNIIAVDAQTRNSSRSREERDEGVTLPVMENGINSKPRHYTHKVVRKLEQLLKRKCLNKTTEECQQLSKMVMEGIVAINLEKKDNLTKSLFQYRYCLNQTTIVPYDPEDKICCNGIHERRSHTMECCGGVIISATVQSCCNDVIHKRLGNHDCCNGEYLNTTDVLCCSGFPRRNGPNTECCGTDVYNTQSQLCCFQQFVHNITEQKEDTCCGKRVYNSDTAICCEGNVYPIEGKEQCCKNVTYNVECFRCDNSRVKPVFDENTHFCCGERVMSKTFGELTDCCEGQSFSRSSHFCESGNVVARTEATTIRTTKRSMGDTGSGTSLEEEGIEPQTAASGSNSLIVILTGGVVVLVTGIFFLVLLRKDLVQCYKHTQKKTHEPRERVLHNNHVVTPPGVCSIEDGHSDEVRTVDVEGLHTSEERNGMFSSSECNEELKSSSHTENCNTDYTRFEKQTLTKEANTLGTYFKDSSVQTCPTKASNCRTVFGKPFDYNFVLGNSSGTVEMPHSEVKMTLPQSVLKESTAEVNCSTFSSIPALRIKFGISDDEMLASAVVEYLLTGIGKLLEHALIKMPFIGPISKLKVWKFKSDEGLNSVAISEEVPMQEKTNEDLDFFYLVDGCMVLIYTKSFSGFYCTTCRHRPLQLKSFLFGSFKKFINPLRFEVRMSLYIADTLMKFEDYRNRMFTNEDAEGKVFKCEKQINLPKLLVVNDELKASLTPMEDHLTQWKHKTYPGGTDPIYSAEQMVKLSEIVEKCKKCPHCHLIEHDLPYKLEWYMVNIEGIRPFYTFQCLVIIEVKHVEDNSVERTPIIIDELQLRHEDKYPEEEGCDMKYRLHYSHGAVKLYWKQGLDSQFARRIRGIKECITHLEEDKRNAVISALTGRLNCPATSVEDTFEKLEERYKPPTVLEAIVSSLKEKQMFRELDLLESYNFIPSNLTHTAVQPVFNAVPDVIVFHAGYSPNASAEDNLREEQEAAVRTCREADLGTSGNCVKEAGLVQNGHQHKKCDGDIKSDMLLVGKDNEARAEIGQQFPCSYDAIANEQDKSAPSSFAAAAVAPLGELGDRTVVQSVPLEFQNLHVQEHACLEETTRKVCATAN